MRKRVRDKKERVRTGFTFSGVLEGLGREKGARVLFEEITSEKCSARMKNAKP